MRRLGRFRVEASPDVAAILHAWLGTPPHPGRYALQGPGSGVWLIVTIVVGWGLAVLGGGSVGREGSVVCLGVQERDEGVQRGK